MICGEPWRRRDRIYWRRSPHSGSVMPHHPYRRRPRRAPLAALIPLFCSCAAAALTPARAAESAARDTGGLRATLTNGLRVVIVRNALAPVVATSVNYLVRSDATPLGVLRTE